LRALTKRHTTHDTGQEQKTVPKGELTGFAAAYDSEAAAAEDNTQNYYEEMSINQIINGDVHAPRTTPHHTM
jgi:hypothetical protein